MEGSAVTDPVPAVEEPEITSDATASSRPAGPTVSDGSGGGDGSAASCPWSLTHERQVHNLKENWKRALNYAPALISFGNDFDTNPWFASVVTRIRENLCLDTSELQIDQSSPHKSLFQDALLCGGEVQIDQPPPHESLLLDALEYGGEVQIDQAHIGDFPGLHSLDLAVLMGDLKMVQEILYRGSVPDNVISNYEDFYITPLHLAVLGGDRCIVDALLEKGANVNADHRLQVFGTPLDIACKLRDVTMLQQLLAKDKEKKDPLHVAMRIGDVDFMKTLPSLNVNVLDHNKKTPLHYLAMQHFDIPHVTDILQFLAQDKALDVKALDRHGLSAFYVAVLHCNTHFVVAFLDVFKDQIRLNEACDHFGPPIQIAFEGGLFFEDIARALMECNPVKGYMEVLYRDRQVYVDAANAILVGAALIASVTFASWLQPPLSYTAYSGEGYSSSVPAPSTSNLSYVDVEHNIALRAFWVFNALSFYFAIGTVVCGARSVLPRSHLFIKKTVEKLRTNLLVTSILLACSALFVIIAFAIAGTIVLTPLVKYQWYMIVPTIVGGMVCIVSLGFLVKSMVENYPRRRAIDFVLLDKARDYLVARKYYQKFD